MDVRSQKDLNAARAALRQLAQRWQRRLLFSAMLRATGFALTTLVLLSSLASWNVFWGIGTAVLLFLFLYVWQFWFIRKKQQQEPALARHLNRILPTLEESAELLLRADSSLTPLAQMQRQRVISAMPRALGAEFLPQQPLRSAWRAFAALVLVALLVAASSLLLHVPRFAPQTAPSISDAERSQPAALPADAVMIDSVAIRIEPPPYTHRPARVAAQFDVEVEEEALLRWKIAFNQNVQRAALVWLEGDTLALRPIQEHAYEATARAHTSTLYQLWLLDHSGAARVFEYHRLEILPDLPPAILVTAPATRVEVGLQQSRQIPLAATITDDYGVQQTELVATLARGSGEGIKFRETIVRLDALQKISPQQWRVHEALQLDQLGMRPGDELYFYVQAYDNHLPVAHSSRSDAFFITMLDTARIEVAASAGLLINPIPEYFRSQRQVIIDTERLLHDRPKISENEFQQRSRNLGLDQQALRLRYGQFLGEEFEESSVAPSASGARGDDHQGDEESKPKATAPAGDKAGAEQVISRFAHMHDVAENATLFAPALKAQLRAALAEMWEAELRLRTHRPQEALPFEYRALAFLKAVQQSTRAYVQRVGFEPPPIKIEETRLHGDLAPIAGGTWQTAIPARDDFAVLREALTILEKPERSVVQQAILERAGQELARQALRQPLLHLRALDDLRTLLDDWKRGNKLCAPCLLSVQRALWQALPPPAALPAPRATTQSTIAVKYFMQLALPRPAGRAEISGQERTRPR